MIKENAPDAKVDDPKGFDRRGSEPGGARIEAATPRGTDCTSTGGLVALVIGAGPDTNRSAGLHSRVVFAPKGSTCGLPSSPAAGLTCVMHLREHVFWKIFS